MAYKINDIISYGIQNKKRKDEIMAALLQGGADIPTATTTLKALNESGVFEYDQTGQNQPSVSNNFGIDQTELNTEQNKAFGFGKRTLESGKIIGQLENNIAGKGVLGSIGQAIDEKQVGSTLFNKYVPQEFQQFDQARRDFVNAVLRRESGAAISPEEFNSAEKQYFPVPGDSPETIEQKRKNRELVTKNLLGEAGVDTNSITLEDSQMAQGTQGQMQQGSQPNKPLTLNTPEEAAQWLQANPNDPRATQVQQKLQSINYNPNQSTTTPPTGQMTQETAQQSENQEKKGTLTKIGEGIGKFLGGNKIGEAIGNVIGTKMAKSGEAGKIFEETINNIENKYQEGKITKEERDRLIQGQKRNAEEAFKYTGPNKKEITGDALQVALTFAPIGKAAKLAGVGAKAIGLTKGAKTLGKVATGFGVGATADISQNAKYDKEKLLDLGAGTAISTAIPIFGAGLRLNGTFLKKAGSKIQQSVIKPTSRDIKDGFNIDNVQKYNLGGSLGQTLAKTNAKINQLGQQLKKKLGDSAEKINLNEIYQEVAQDLSKNKMSSFGDNKGIQRVLKSLEDEIAEISKNGNVDVVGAQQIKRAAGTKGSWSFGMADPDAKATEKIYNTFYNKLKNAIEKASPEGIQEINKQLSDLIPISNAVLKRIPVAERNNAISLTDVITLSASAFDPRALGLTAINKLSKSGRVGNILSKAGSKLEGAGINKLPGDVFWDSKPGKSIIQKLKKTQPGLSIKKIKDAKLLSLLENDKRLNNDWNNASASLRKDIEKAIKDNLKEIQKRFKTIKN